MKHNKFFRCGFIILLVNTFFFPLAHAETPDADEMWKIIQQQQKIIEQLQQKLEKTEQKVEVAEQKVEATAQEVEAAAEAIEVAQSSSSGSSWFDRTSIGGYGELHYNNLSDDNDTVGGNDARDRVDFHRFVLYFGHEFTDSIRFFSVGARHCR